MRSKYALINMTVGPIAQTVIALLGMFSRGVFIQTLSVDLGLNWRRVKVFVLTLNII